MNPITNNNSNKQQWHNVQVQVAN